MRLPGYYLVRISPLTHTLFSFLKGHDYYGRSSAADSLLIWTHSMRNIEFHEKFTPDGCDNGEWHAVTMEAGLTWMDVYAAASVDRDLVKESSLRYLNPYIF